MKFLHSLSAAKTILLLVCLSVTLTTIAQIQQPLSDSQAQQIEAIINDEIAQQELIGVAIGVVNNGQIAYTQGFGYADRNTRQKVDLDSKFRWASMAKSLTSMAAFKLWEDGKLDFDKDIHHYVSNFPEQAVTMNHLLQNQGGIGHYSEMNRDWGCVKSPLRLYRCIL